MKKLLVIAAVFASFALTSCEKSAKDYADELVDLYSKYETYVQEGDTEKAAKVEKEAQALIMEMTKRAMTDPEFADEMKKVGEQLESIGQ